MPQPADELRTAATLLRQLATAASTDQEGYPTTHWAVRYQPGVLPGDPPQTDRSCYLDAVDTADADGRGGRRLLHGSRGARTRPPSVDPQHGRYIAAMDPGVGLAVADWLEQEARIWAHTDEQIVKHASEAQVIAQLSTFDQALAVARQVLGTTETPAAPPATDRAPSCRCHSREGLRPEQHENDCPMAVLPAPTDRYRTAWHNARSRAAVLSAEITRRAPLLGEYAAQINNLRTMYDVAAARTSDLIDERDQLRAERTELIRQRDQAAMDTIKALPEFELRGDTEIRTAALREGADALGRMDYDVDATDYGWDTYRDAWDTGVMNAAGLLRRLADEAQQPTTAEAEAHRTLTEFIAEVLEDDGIWMYLGADPDRAVAERRRASVTRRCPAAETRTVRKTTTYTVATPTKAEHLPKGTNAEDCPACKGANPGDPFLCPGPDMPASTEEPKP
ncbi:hypothetical protein EDD93_3698 [Streptomyces sp. 840.1]|uniref:hypothetical protein n=1 Tax=Streptomyces sp. 840.1 TaxID=2485152 RepID=UPI000F493A49|nr:hypothetical protein [Streptomyces sp. 840.1]ROQ69201.1 hypothetical protein EDD93_3698 [Streptomyces sp. 840.1]